MLITMRYSESYLGVFSDGQDGLGRHGDEETSDVKELSLVQNLLLYICMFVYERRGGFHLVYASLALTLKTRGESKPCLDGFALEVSLLVAVGSGQVSDEGSVLVRDQHRAGSGGSRLVFEVVNRHSVGLCFASEDLSVLILLYEGESVSETTTLANNNNNSRWKDGGLTGPLKVE